MLWSWQATLFHCPNVESTPQVVPNQAANPRFRQLKDLSGWDSFKQLRSNGTTVEFRFLWAFSHRYTHPELAMEFVIVATIPMRRFSETDEAFFTFCVDIFWKAHLLGQRACCGLGEMHSTWTLKHSANSEAQIPVAKKERTRTQTQFKKQSIRWILCEVKDRVLRGKRSWKICVQTPWVSKRTNERRQTPIAEVFQTPTTACVLQVLVWRWSWRPSPRKVGAKCKDIWSASFLEAKQQKQEKEEQIQRSDWRFWNSPISKEGSSGRS